MKRFLSIALTGAAEKFQKLSEFQISWRLDGMEITDDVHYANVFKSGGNLLSYSMCQQAGRIDRNGP